MTDDRYNRIPSTAGFCEPSKLPKGPNGRALCRGCGHEVPTGRASWCSDDCVQDHKLRTQPEYQARKMLERDHGVCSACGVDCVVLLTELRNIDSLEPSFRWCGKSGPLALAHLEKLGIKPGKPIWRNRSRLWEVDHVTPVSEGGGSCGLENLRTLCHWCHLKETAALRKRLAAKRRGEDGNETLFEVRRPETSR